MIHHYKILKSISKGGMGEIFLVHDPICKREVALKQILPKLRNHAVIRARFLREAEVAASLNHPSIIPVFAIDESPEKLYYTMPYIEGATLKQILKRCLEEEQRPLPSFMPIFLKLCEAMEYVHAKKIVHRDLKPDNILIGKHGEVVIVDWGLSDFEGSSCQETELDDPPADLTRPGKVPGTLNYIAPERLQGVPTSSQMDIYSLGVILYQLLTLRSPFKRGSLEEFKKGKKEEIIPPCERAPEYSIPESLNALCMRCLTPDPKDRVQEIKTIIQEVTAILSGHPQRMKTTLLNPHLSDDWEFQENILLTKHLAITGSPKETRWAHLMVSKHNFFTPFQLDVRFTLSVPSEGISFLIGIPPAEERKSFLEGLQISLGATSQLLYNGAVLMALPSACIIDNLPHELSLEFKEQSLLITLDGKQIAFYLLRIPLPGNQIGLFTYDATFTISSLEIKEKGHTALVSCLAIPDAFLGHGDFKKARIEYQKIADSFPGSTEEKEALFRSGISFLEEAQTSPSPLDREQLHLLALQTFDKLHNTSYAPLEYIGKSLVYQAGKELEEEIKCLELALRKYKKHPLIATVHDQLMMRLYETASSDRPHAYALALLALMQIPQMTHRQEHATLFSSLHQHLSSHPLIRSKPCLYALHLGKVISLLELSETADPKTQADACYALLLLGMKEEAEENISLLTEEKEELLYALSYFREGPAFALERALQKSSPEAIRCLYFLLERSLIDNRIDAVVPFLPLLPNTPLIDSLHFFILLSLKQTQQAHALLLPYSDIQTDSPLFLPFGYFLLHTQGERAALHHFAAAPPFSIASLLCNYLKKPKEERESWMNHQLLFWEKTTLKRYETYC